MENSEKLAIAAIDDDPVVLNLLVSMLKADYSVRPFTSGKTALNMLPALKPSLILLDHQMPDMLGLDVLKAIKLDERICEIPTIFLTSSTDSENEVEALENGAVDYIIKPFRKRSLLTRVHLQLELQSHRKHLETLIAERTKGLSAAYNKLKAREEITLNMLARATEMRDHGTGDHVERTTLYTHLLVNHLVEKPQPGYCFTKEKAEDVIRSSKLHDVGKIALPDYILLKPGRLTDEEFVKVKEHTLYGERFLDEFIRKMDDSFLDTAREIAYGHHERWDGTGYPTGQRGEEIPLAARIVAIADVYDALTSERSYKRALPHAEAMEIMCKNAGTQFDPYLIGIFMNNANEVFRISKQTSETVLAEMRAIC